MADKYVPKLGDTITDNVTGMTGVIVGDLRRLHESRTYEIQPSILRDGVPQPSLWLPAGRLDHLTFD